MKPRKQQKRAPVTLSGDTKLTNPKQAFGDAKMPLDLLPDTAVVMFNLAFLEGALKYGQYNWRVAGVRVSTYVRAMRRHLSKFWNGADHDPVTLVHELASVGACAAIMLDAIAVGKLTDDRPPRADMDRALAQAATVAAHLKQLFKDYHPPQYTEREHGAQSRGERVALMGPIECSAEPGGCKGCRAENARRAKIVPAGTKQKTSTITGRKSRHR